MFEGGAMKKAALYGLSEEELLAMSHEEMVAVLRGKKKEQYEEHRREQARELYAQLQSDPQKAQRKKERKEYMKTYLKEYQPKWAKKNRKRLNNYSNTWRKKDREQNREKYRTREKEYYKIHRERIIVQNRNWKKQTNYYSINREALCTKHRARYLQNHENILARRHQLCAENYPAVLAKRQARYLKNREEIRKKQNEYAIATYARNKPKKQKYAAEHREERKTYARQYQKRKYAEDIEFKLKTRLRTRLWAALRGNSKDASTLELLGCTIPELRAHLEAQFIPGQMSWDNYGNKKDSWSLDHIRPLGSFLLTDPVQLREACHYSNLRPLWHIENISRPKPIRSKTPKAA